MTPLRTRRLSPRLARYEDAFSVEDKALLLTRLQHYAVVVTAGWKTAVKTSKRAELTVCGIELQAGHHNSIKISTTDDEETIGLADEDAEEAQ